jgi:hypothetical protein
MKAHIQEISNCPFALTLKHTEVKWKQIDTRNYLFEYLFTYNVYKI